MQVIYHVICNDPLKLKKQMASHLAFVLMGSVKFTSVTAIFDLQNNNQNCFSLKVLKSCFKDLKMPHAPEDQHLICDNKKTFL